MSERVIALIWPQVCDEVADDAGLVVTFRAALTWKLYDRALLFAVAYPIFLLVGFWIFSFPAQDGKLGDITVLDATPFWPVRAATLGAIVLVFISPNLTNWAAASPKVFLRKVSGWLPPIAVAAAFAVAAVVAAVFASVVAGVFAGAVVVAVVFAITGGAAGASVVAFAVAAVIAIRRPQL